MDRGSRYLRDEKTIPWHRIRIFLPAHKPLGEQLPKLDVQQASDRHEIRISGDSEQEPNLNLQVAKQTDAHPQPNPSLELHLTANIFGGWW